LQAAISLIVLLVFAEISAANFKRLAPILEAWDHNKRQLTEWHGGWEKLAVLCWSAGTAIPLLAFALACQFFLPVKEVAYTLAIGSAVGSNIIALSLCFGILLAAGPMSFFRIRTITSPIFLLFATLSFTFTTLNQKISTVEGLVLLALVVAYGFYFRRFSSEWKYYERSQSTHLIESSEGVLPLVAVLCMGLGFFILAVLAAYPFVQYLYHLVYIGKTTDARLAVHVVALLLASPWVLRIILSEDSSDSARAMAMTALSHTCLLNILFLPGIMALFFSPAISLRVVAIDLPALLLFTSTFVASLLIEKEKGTVFTLVLLGSYLLYTGLGVFL
jgi:Ca2+/Na+ antiporter